VAKFDHHCELARRHFLSVSSSLHSHVDIGLGMLCNKQTNKTSIFFLLVVLLPFYVRNFILKRGVGAQRSVL
jgi:hypothetical protein